MARSVNVTLEEGDLWDQFKKITNEMIVTKAGRRMFPVIKVDAKGLEPNAFYAVYLEFKQIDNNRWKYINGEWIAGGKAEPPPINPVYKHPDSPNYGQHWTKESINFAKVKLSNKVNNDNQIVLNSLHKYEPRIMIVKVNAQGNQDGNGELVYNVALPSTQFIAVTAYQNEEVTQLKIKNNPFAKAFLDNNSRSFAQQQQHHQEAPPMNIVMNSFETTEQAREFHAYYNRISMNNGVGGQGKIKSQTPSPNDSVGSPRVSPYSRPKIGGGSGRKLKQEAVGGGYVPNGCWSTSVSLANEGGPLNGALTQSTPPTTVTGIGALGFEPTPSQNDLVCWQNPPISYPTQNVSPTSPVPASAPNSLGHCHETEFQNYPGGGSSNSYSSYNYHQDSLYQFQPYPNLPLNPNELSFHHQQQQQHHHHHHPYYGQGLQPPELHHHMSNISSPVLVKAEQHSPPSQELIQSRLAMTPQPADLNVSDDQQLAVASSSNPGGNWSPLTPPEIGKSTDSTLQRVNWHGRESAQS